MLRQVELEAEAELRGWVSADLVGEVTELRRKRGVNDVVWMGLEVGC